MFPDYSNFIHLAGLIQQASSKTDAVLTPSNTRFGLTNLQATVLTAVQHHPGCTMGDLSRFLSMVPPALTRLVDGLVRDGLIERFTSSTDRRVVVVQLTIRGHYIADNIQRDIGGHLSRVLATLSEGEIESLQTGLEKYSNAISTFHKG